MERKKFLEVSKKISSIEEKNRDLDELLSNFSDLSRKNMVREITQKIIKNSLILKQMGVNKDLILPNEEQEEPLLFQAIVENSISEIKRNPTKKVIILKDLLDKMPEITVNDKKVILQSLKDEKIENLTTKILDLVKIFKLAL